MLFIAHMLKEVYVKINFYQCSIFKG